MDAQMASPSGELWLDTDPDRTEFGGVAWAQGLDRSEAVSADGQGGTGPRAMAISVLPMGPASDGIEVKGCSPGLSI